MDASKLKKHDDSIIYNDVGSIVCIEEVVQSADKAQDELKFLCVNIRFLNDRKTFMCKGESSSKVYMCTTGTSVRMN